MLKSKDFLDVERHIQEEDYPIVCIISDRGLGKTHSAFKYAEKITTVNKTKFTVTRLNMEPFKKFKDDIENNYGWKCSVAGQTIKKDGETIAYLSSLNTYANAKGGTYNDVELMIFDEFNEDVYIENAFAKFVMLVDSFKRHRNNFKCILLGNMINKNNWFLNAMGLRADWKAKEDKIYYLKEYGVKVIIIGSQSYQNVVNARKDINKLASADPAAHAFYNEREFLNDDTCMVTNFIKWVEPTFIPMYWFRYGPYKYLFGRYKEEDGRTYYFVDRDNVYFKDYTNVKEFSFDNLGAMGDKKTQILDDEDISGFQQQFFVFAKTKRMMFGSFDCYEDLQMFIAIGAELI